MARIKVSIVDVLKRVIKWDKKADIYLNGEDNLYPDRVDLFKNNSVTAKMASEIMTQNLLGGGFEGVENFVVDSVTNLKVIDFAEDVARSIVDHKGVYIWVMYDTTFKAVKTKVVPFSHARLGLKDSNEWNGKFLIKKDWSKKNKDEPIEIDAFNPSEKVITEQIVKAGGIQKYKGQIYYFNCERQFYYPTSRIDAVMNDCDSESQSSIYKNELLRKGFFGKTLFMTRPLIDEDIEEYISDSDGDRVKNPLYIQADTEAETLRTSIKDFLGAEKAGGAMLIETDFDGEKMEEWFATKTIESKIDPDLFLNVETSLRKNILIAYNNLPIGLVVSSESMFANSGEAIIQMKEQYWENTKKERELFLRIIQEILKLWNVENELSIIPLIEKQKAHGEPNN